MRHLLKIWIFSLFYDQNFLNFYFPTPSAVCNIAERNRISISVKQDVRNSRLPPNHSPPWVFPTQEVNSASTSVLPHVQRRVTNWQMEPVSSSTTAFATGCIFPPTDSVLFSVEQEARVLSKHRDYRTSKHQASQVIAVEISQPEPRHF